MRRNPFICISLGISRLRVHQALSIDAYYYYTPLCLKPIIGSSFNPRLKPWVNESLSRSGFSKSAFMLSQRPSRRKAFPCIHYSFAPMRSLREFFLFAYNRPVTCIQQPVTGNWQPATNYPTTTLAFDSLSLLAHYYSRMSHFAGIKSFLVLAHLD